MSSCVARGGCASHGHSPPPLPLPPPACSTDNANVCSLNVGSASMLAASALHGAGLLGCGAAACQALQLGASADTDPGGQRRVRALLTALLSSGVPLLVATGLKTRQAAEDAWKSLHGNLTNGSVLLLVDDAQNVVGLGQPVGRPVYVAEGGDGFLPAEVRHGLDGADAEHFTCLQLWVRLLCVADYDSFARTAWFRGDAGWSTLLNWAVELGADDRRRACNATSVLPANIPAPRLFPSRLPELGVALDGFDAKLQAVEGPLHRPARQAVKIGAMTAEEVALISSRKRDDAAEMLQFWRRAVLVQQLLLRCDVTGGARAALRGVLPDCLLGPSCAVVAPLPAVQPVRCGSLQPGLGAADVLEAVRGVGAAGRTKPVRDRWRRR